MSEKICEPKIRLDLVYFRIRIHASTLEALNNPKYIMLMINPKDMSLGILGLDSNEKGAHRVRFHRNRKYCELYSMALLMQITKSCPGIIEQGQKYSFRGTKVKNDNIVKFNILKEA